MSSEHASEGTVAVERALGLLSAIVNDDGAQPLARLAARLDIPISTAHRFADALMRKGLITRVARGRYAMSYALARAGGTAKEHSVLARLARPSLRELAQRTGTNVHLGILEGDMVTYLVKESGGAPLFTREGMQLEAYCSGVGKLLLAYMPTHALDAYLANGPFVPLTPATMVDPADIRQALDQVRAQDFATDDREIAEDLGCMAVPVRAGEGRVVAALSSSASPPRTAARSAIQELRACAQEIERKLA